MFEVLHLRKSGMIVFHVVFAVLMNRHTIKACPICGKKRFNHFAECKDWVISEEIYSLLKCEDCGMIFTQDAPTEEDLPKYDKIKQKLAHGDAPRGLLNNLYYYARQIMLTRKAKLVERLSCVRNGTLLNFGAKTGFFSNRMIRRGWRVTSVERHHEERLFSLEFFHHRMLDIKELDSQQSGFFDVITLWHVFEHLHSPADFLDKFFDLLKPNGLLFIAVPNCQSFDAGHYGAGWAAYDAPRHLWHFNTDTITRLCHQRGFILMYHQAMPLDSFYVSIMSEKHLRHWFPFIRGFFVGLYGWAQSINKRDRGSSLVYVFRKNKA